MKLPTMLTLNANTGNFILRGFLLILALLIGYVIFVYGRYDPANEKVIWWKLRVIHIFYAMLWAVLFLIATIISSFLGIAKVEVDKTSGTINFKGLLFDKSISTSEIDHYFETIHRNQFKTFEGILLILKNNKTIQLAGQNLKSIAELREYLIETGVPASGLRKMKFPFN